MVLEPGTYTIAVGVRKYSDIIPVYIVLRISVVVPFTLLRWRWGEPFLIECLCACANLWFFILFVNLFVFKLFCHQTTKHIPLSWYGTAAGLWSSGHQEEGGTVCTISSSSSIHYSVPERPQYRRYRTPNVCALLTGLMIFARSICFALGLHRVGCCQYTASNITQS